jgi:hypothetical protein
MPDLPDATLLAGLIGWTRIHGVISLELEEHLPSIGIAPAAALRHGSVLADHIEQAEWVASVMVSRCSGLAAAVSTFGKAAAGGLLNEDRDEVADRAVGEGLVLAVNGPFDLVGAQLGELPGQSLGHVADRLAFRLRMPIVKTAVCHARLLPGVPDVSFATIAAPGARLSSPVRAVGVAPARTGETLRPVRERRGRATCAGSFAPGRRPGPTDQGLPRVRRRRCQREAWLVTALREEELMDTKLEVIVIQSGAELPT